MESLKNETAEALLTAIRDAAPRANHSSLEALARAYALVCSAGAEQQHMTFGC